ncbi:hypothetical protein AYO42_05905 [Rhizomicrobium sp. SCGC AG-212-E05]|nr:hypothetical protein AYO42_05905 [Rhizomicrobium sp. SCGC AG-212-E05]
MTRGRFIAGLRQNLRGLSADEVADIVADYEEHFTDAAAAGRSEEDVAAALGDPARLAGELSAETGLRRWEERRNPRTFLRAGMGVFGLQAFNILVLLPVIGILLFCAGVAAYVLYVVAGTGFHMMAQATSGNGNVLVPALAGFGLVCGVVGIGALLALLLDSGLRLLANYARMNYRLLKPKDEE